MPLDGILRMSDVTHGTVTVEATAAPEEQWAHIQSALRGMKFGQVTIVVHDGSIVQVDRMERRRFTRKP